MGIPEVGNRWEFLGNSLLENSAFREFPWNSHYRGVGPFTEGIFTSRECCLYREYFLHCTTSHYFIIQGSRKLRERAMN